MTIKAILFDLDGTLLPMDQDIFVKNYFSGLAAKAAPLGYESSQLIKAIWDGTGAMVKNNGVKSNAERFWDHFASVYGEEARSHEAVFADFYAHEFNEVAKVCGHQPQSAALITELKGRGYRLILATNPIFPEVATLARMHWAGLDRSDFELITTYENSRHCKPNPDYYRDILAAIGLDARECLMVGNDMGEDMIAADLGMQVFLLTDCLINKTAADIDAFPHGDFDRLWRYMLQIND